MDVQMFDTLLPFNNIYEADIMIIDKYKTWTKWIELHITKTYLYNFDPLKPHFYIIKLGVTGVYIIFFYFCSKP